MKKRTIHFNEKSAARVVAYARRDGANDKELMHLVIEAYGLTNVSCLISQSLLMFTNKILADSVIMALLGCLGIIKGFKIIAEGRISRFTIVPMDHFWRHYFPRISEYYGVFVLALSTAIAALSSTIVFMDTMVDQVEYYFFLDDVCKIQTPANPFPITPIPPNFKLFYEEDEIEKAQLERFGDLFDTVFPDNTI